MATGNSGETKQAGATSRPGPSGRAARTKVALPVSGSKASASASSGRRRRPPAPPRPWYRQGRFWFGVIVLEAVVALALSIRFMPASNDVSLDGADLGQFCIVVAKGQSMGATSQADSGSVAELWGSRVALLKELQPVAPQAVRPDIGDLITLYSGVQSLALDIKDRNSTDPAYDGSALLNAKLAQVDTQGKAATDRLNLATLKGCGVDLTAPPPSTAPVTTAVPGPPAPGGPTAPGGGTPSTSAGATPTTASG